ncbi:uncharacterized protein ACIGJ3_008489 [Trichechus inunguis]|uniref:Calmodulin-like n=1 Tax=Trichechus manatus latirostris TaxID=127582 RepID=A0A2Y9G198_TRIMA|nr:calmodulin-like [Trichechus manatus latirostris]
MAEDLTEEQVEEFKQAFTMFDTNGDGTINVQELGQLMQSLGQNVPEDQLKVLIAMVDTDGDGVIDFQEFLAAIAKRMKGKDTEENTLAVFREFDVDGNGHITVAELKQAMGKLGVKLSEEEVDGMIREADVDQDGKVNYQEFLRMLAEK